ncbi:MAG: metallophosphoesterase, partial [Deltaproteobacteria bacterium]|nr:metallophosphoesterase [Deltaproteobacteria bacterium]
MRAAQVLMFLAVVILVVGGIHYLLWARLVRDPAWPAPWPRIGAALLWALGLSLPLGMFAGRVLPRPVMSPLAWGLFTWMGAAFVFFVLVSLGELARLAATALGALHDPARRQWFARAVAA